MATGTQQESFPLPGNALDMAVDAGLACRACPQLYGTRWDVCPHEGLQDCRESLDGQSGWDSFSHI